MTWCTLLNNSGATENVCAAFIRITLSLSLCEYYITFQQAHALNTFVLSGDLRIIDQVSKNFDEKQNIAFQIKWMQN